MRKSSLHESAEIVRAEIRFAKSATYLSRIRSTDQKIAERDIQVRVRGTTI